MQAKPALESWIEEIWERLGPLERRIEDEGQIDTDTVLPILQDLGLLSLLVPSEYGGRGMKIADYVPIIAEIAKIHGGLRALVHVHNSFAHSFARIATREQRENVLPGVATGDESIAFALTEPDFGSGADVGTTARPRQSGGYSLSGRKWLITNSDFATYFLVFARTGPRGSKHLSIFLVPRDSDGLQIDELASTMGCRGGQHGILTFDEVYVPEDGVVGPLGDGLDLMEECLETSRVLVAASSLGVAERAFQLALDYARTRVTFGRPIATRQAVQRYLAEMAVDIHALRLLVEDAAGRIDAGERVSAEASMVKLFGLEAVGRVTDRALLTHGGIGYTTASSLERLYRDARLNWLEEGTPTIHHMIIAREILAATPGEGEADSAPSLADRMQGPGWAGSDLFDTRYLE